MRMIKITEGKKDEMSELAEKMLHYGGKLMTCLESLDTEGYGERMGMREWDEDDDTGMRMGMRDTYGVDHRQPGPRESGYGERGRSSRTGRYTRY